MDNQRLGPNQIKYIESLPAFDKRKRAILLPIDKKPLTLQITASTQGAQNAHY